jgi:hypothetical protein
MCRILRTRATNFVHRLCVCVELMVTRIVANKYTSAFWTTADGNGRQLIYVGLVLLVLAAE